MPNSKLESLFVIPSSDDRKTFEEDDKLPSLPVPDIRHTLTRYLESLKPFVGAEEYAKTFELVQLFEQETGRMLHEKLKKKAETERNWAEKWWENVAYLQVRLPLIPYCSMDGVLPKNISFWSYGTEDDQIKHASLSAYHLVRFWELLRTEKLLQTQTADKKTNFSMSQYRRLFNTVRVPGDEVDSLACYFKTVAEGSCSSNVIIMSKGRLFITDALDPKGNILTPVDWEEILKKILSICEEPAEKSCLGILTCDSRSNWSKNRRHLGTLSKRNKEILQLIDESMFVVVLDDDSPETDSDVTNCNMCGDYNNRWADKSMSMIFYKNGRCGAICDHTACDGIITITCHHYLLTAVEESDWHNGKTHPVIPEFDELRFEVDETLETEMDRLKHETWEYRQEILMTRHTFEDYGKVEIQRLKFHPDSYVQMCLQLAYVALHRKPAPCYETATTRKFFNGRTETLRSCTTECLDWVDSMLNSESSNETRKRLLERAIKRHDELMNEARDNAGCDRHLFGLYCMALEEGMDIPDLYIDPSYLKSGGGGNFVLSTSCTGYTPLGGGVAPMCRNGYGVFYNILPNRLYFTISVNTKSSETDADKYFVYLRNSLRHTRQVLLLANRNMSKF